MSVVIIIIDLPVDGVLSKAMVILTRALMIMAVMTATLKVIGHVSSTILVTIVIVMWGPTIIVSMVLASRYIGRAVIRRISMTLPAMSAPLSIPTLAFTLASLARAPSTAIRRCGAVHFAPTNV